MISVIVEKIQRRTQLCLMHVTQKAFTKRHLKCMGFLRLKYTQVPKVYQFFFFSLYNSLKTNILKTLLKVTPSLIKKKVNPKNLTDKFTISLAFCVILKYFSNVLFQQSKVRFFGARILQNIYSRALKEYLYCV